MRKGTAIRIDYFTKMQNASHWFGDWCGFDVLTMKLDQLNHLASTKFGYLSVSYRKSLDPFVVYRNVAFRFPPENIKTDWNVFSIRLDSIEFDSKELESCDGKMLLILRNC